MRKRFTALILILLMCLTLMPIGAFAADVVDGGKCGDSLTWSLNSDGLLTVSGTGRMPNYKYGENAEDTMPWESCKNEIKSVVIEDGVTYIGNGAFYECKNLETVVIGNDVKAMDGLSFACCNIKNVTFGSSVEHISGFFGNSNLREVIFPSSFKELGVNAFYDCGLVSVKFLGNAPTDISCLFGLCSGMSMIDDADKITLYIPQGNTTWTDSELYDTDAQTFCGFHIEFYNATPDSPDDGGSSGNFFSRLLDTIRNIFRSLFSWLPFC